MRHSKRRHKLGVSGPHRLALLANLSVALITHGKIKTTLAKAKALRPFVEKVITLAKKAENANETERKLHFRRLAISRLNNVAAVAMLFDERVFEFMERPGGYTRIYKLGQRIGDAAEMALIELIDGNDEGYTKSTSKKKAAAKPVQKETETAVSEESTEDASEAAVAIATEDTVEPVSDTEETVTVAADEVSTANESDTTDASDDGSSVEATEEVETEEAAPEASEDKEKDS